MLEKPWRTISLIGWSAFIIGVIVGYYQCQIGTCSLPSFWVAPESQSLESLQSQLVGATKRQPVRRPLALRRSIVAPSTPATPSVPSLLPVPQSVTPTTPLAPALPVVPVPVAPASVVPDPVETVPMSFLSQFPNLRISYKGGQGIRSRDLELVALALYPFRDMLSRINTTIFIHYDYQALGSGIRAFTAQTGKVIHMIAPNAYFRQIAEQEWVNILQHEMAHVFHDQILSYRDRKEWENIILHQHAVPSELVFTQYARTDEYEALAEILLSYFLLNTDRANEVRADLFHIYKFITSRLDILGIEKQRLRREPDLKPAYPLGKDATRQTDYSLPRLES